MAPSSHINHFFITIITLIITFSFFTPIHTVDPIAVFHGVSDGCKYMNTSQLVANLSRDLNTTVECIEIGNGFMTSWFRNITTQCEQACEAINNNPSFVGNFSILGISQGTLISRYIIQKCNLINRRVVRYLSFEGPQQGVAGIPNLNCGSFCDFINNSAGKHAMKDVVYRNIAPTNYLKPRYHYDEYLEKNQFLKYLNNEIPNKDEEIRNRFKALEKLMLIKGNRDTVINPKDS